MHGAAVIYLVGLVAVVFRQSDIGFLVLDARSKQSEEPFAYVPLSDRAIPFELQLDKSGVLHVSVDGKIGRTVSVDPSEITRVRLSCFAGHARFSNIEVTA